jgi:serine protease Do
MKRPGTIALVILSTLCLSLEAQDTRTPAEELQAVIEGLAKKVFPAFVFMSNGSGVLISPDGYILTNYHVAALQGSTPTITTGDGKRYKVRKVAVDIWGDIALLKVIGGDKLAHVEFGNIEDLEVGEYVVAFGNPFNIAYYSMQKEMRPSVSLGIVSALKRSKGNYADAIQTDAAINPGNSGGPLLSLDGKLIGIIGKIETRFYNRINTGVAYAISIDQIKRFLPVMKKGGDQGVVYHGTIKGLIVSKRFTNGKGAVVLKVQRNTTAEKVGFKRHDMIIAVNGIPVFNRARFLNLINMYPERTIVSVDVRRGQELKRIRLKLDRDTRRFFADYGLPEERRKANAGYLGIGVVDIEEGYKTKVSIQNVMPGSPADRAGLLVGDVIKRLNRKKIGSAEEFLKRLKEMQAGTTITLIIERQREELEFNILLAKYPD